MAVRLAIRDDSGSDSGSGSGSESGSESDDLSSKVSDEDYKHRLRVISAAIRERSKENGMLAKYNGVYAKSDTHEDYIRAFHSSVYTNLIREFFTMSLIRKLLRTDTVRCQDCSSVDNIQRCHTVPRPELLRMALEQCCPYEDVDVRTIDLMCVFLRLHAKYPLEFKCEACHKKDTHNTKIPRVSGGADRAQPTITQMFQRMMMIQNVDAYDA